eukprot:CAMPEP_0202458552 /NCGR_PEP_ID=MMETSP1360-20130828/26444_1 /ASSEMBLY_ACC=CAM_ASM_000848 /TAXON_ID=515479 /ORGANISM="Licmophora paradoxa, Strain CCMP2313" /LENGTH=104 /DNA_ID=CAMNT_0049079151 /DNA_START=305 /DNA_END=619 /DNA_ORIENTATION=-
MDPAFHWNIKQLFVYIVASYETEENPVNQVVLWDSIVENVDENKLLQQNNVFVKYALVDPGDALRGKDITLSLHWDHMPLTGFMFQGHQDLQTASQFTLPNEYQ